LQDKPLPKLTAEVFDRPDCPEWAQYAVVDCDGYAWWYKDVPTRGVAGKWFCDDTYWKGTHGIWDASDWQNSLIKRPEGTKLPDWVEVGGYVFDARNGYGKIVSGSVKSCYIEFDGGAGDFAPEAFAELKQARLRPFNAEEMMGLVGKVLRGNDTNFRALILYADATCEKIETLHYDYAPEELARSYNIDGNPCGVLEHLENREWVK
jgi:hypothetical protein